MKLNDVQVNLGNLSHPLEALNYIEALQAQSKGVVRSLEGISSMVAFLAITKDPNTWAQLQKPVVTMISAEDLGLSDSGPDKQMMAKAIKLIARKLSAVMICLVSEAWTVLAKTPEDQDLLRKWIQEHGDIAECPLRYEVVLIQTEHKAMDPRHQLWSAPITVVNGVRTVGDFVNAPNTSGGRFCNLLP
jgi:hypothetical protein